MEPDPKLTLIYRSLHSAPLLGGVPVYLALALVAIGSVGGLGLMSVSKIAGILAALVVGLVWGVAAYVYAQDRVRMPLVLLRVRFRTPFPERMSSFRPSGQSIVVEGDR